MNDLLTHRIDGDGEPLLLLNGGLMSIPSWDFVMPELATRYRVIRCDFRGQLLSPGKGHDTLEGHVDDLVALLDHLDIDDAHVFGASFGGEVGLLFAANHPERARSLVILTATDRLTDQMHASSRRLIDLAAAAVRGGDGGEVVRAVLEHTFSERWLATQPADLIDVRAGQIAQMPRSFFEGFLSLMKALERLDFGGQLRWITAPSLIIGAEEDRIFPVAHSRALAAAIPGAELEILEGSGHGAILEATDQVLASMRAFHERVTGAM